jgi:molybdate transport system substrate-binding protein
VRSEQRFGWLPAVLNQTPFRARPRATCSWSASYVSSVCLLHRVRHPARVLSLSAAQDKTIIVFAAASMENALNEVNAAYTAKTGVKVSPSYAASSVLAKQIEQGAPADVFVSADTDWMDYAISKKVINESTRVNLLGNSLVLIAPKDSKIDKVDIRPGFDLAKLAGDGRIATSDVSSVPVGKYAKMALEKLGVWRAVEPRFAMAENVRAALILVARGEAAPWHRLFDRRRLNPA